MFIFSFRKDMKIFSNFDTRLKKKTLEKYQKEYWVDKVIMLWKSGLFRFLKIFLPMFFYLLVLAGAVRLAYIMFDDSNHVIYAWIVVFVLLLLVSWPIIKHYMDYKMDFAVMTPESLIMFNQTWFFKRDTAAIDIDKIKTISITKRSLMYSIFNNWNMIFLSEWDNKNFWEVTLLFIFRPEEKREKISAIIENFRK